MRRFLEMLRDAGPGGDREGRRWIWVPYDQLTDGLGPLAKTAPAESGIVLVESRWKGRRRPYHKQKLALVLANQRHFALEQARRGVAVRYLATDLSYGEALRPVARELGSLTVMRPAEHELREDVAALERDGLLQVAEHEGWLTTAGDFAAATRGKRAWRLDAFYRQVRRRTGLLMENGKPVGGRLSFDAENREPWPGEPPAPDPPRFELDDVKREVGELVERDFADHPGRLDPGALPATREDAERLWEWAKASCLPHFGPFEDAMSRRSRGLFHTRLSPLLNLQRLPAERVMREALERDAPLASREGFLRQILGWREFLRHAHETTDGFRRLPGAKRATAAAPPDYLGSTRPLPPAFWGAESGLACLDEVVRSVWEEGWSHHITRLMVLGNLATLLDVSPRELTDWFWVAYVDAFDWVVEPNVLGMATYALGDLLTTKPYVSGAAYIHRMSDYCTGCVFDPKKDCPITRLYWAFLQRKRQRLEANVRMAMPMRSLAKRNAEQKKLDREVFARVSATLAEGGQLAPGKSGTQAAGRRSRR